MALVLCSWISVAVVVSEWPQLLSPASLFISWSRAPACTVLYDGKGNLHFNSFLVENAREKESWQGEMGWKNPKYWALCYNKSSEFYTSLWKITVAQPLSNWISRDLIKAVFTSNYSSVRNSLILLVLLTLWCVRACGMQNNIKVFSRLIFFSFFHVWPGI